MRATSPFWRYRTCVPHFRTWRGSRTHLRCKGLRCTTHAQMSHMCPALWNPPGEERSRPLLSLWDLKYGTHMGTKLCFWPGLEIETSKFGQGGLWKSRPVSNPFGTSPSSGTRPNTHPLRQPCLGPYGFLPSWPSTGFQSYHSSSPWNEYSQSINSRISRRSGVPLRTSIKSLAESAPCILSRS